MIRFEIDSIHIDGTAPMSWHDALLRVVALLRIRSEGSVLWTEVDFPILELGYHLHQWLALGAHAGSPFSYQSMDSDEEELLWFKPSNDHWVLGTGRMELTGELRLDELRDASSAFLDAVIKDVELAVGLDARAVILRRRGP